MNRAMNRIEIFGYAAQEICAGCEGHCGDGACQPGAKRQLRHWWKNLKALYRPRGFLRKPPLRSHK